MMRPPSIARKWTFRLSLVLFPIFAWLMYWQGRLLFQHSSLLGAIDHPPFWLVVTALGTLLTGAILWGSIETWLNQPSTRHGSAHWARGRELKVYTVKRGESGLVLGQRGWRLIGIGEKRQYEHVAIVGTTGKGKTSLVFVPALLREQGRRSLFVLDAKSELYPITAGALAERHQVWRFAPGEPALSQGYNPLAHIYRFEDAVDFARCWVQNTGESREAFWNNICEQLIAGAALHLRAAEPEAPLARLAELLSEFTMQELRDLFRYSPSQEARKVAAPALNRMASNERLVGSVLTELSSRLFLLQGAGIQQVTAQNEIDFARMGQEAIALFFSVPDGEMQRLRPLVSCFLMRMFAAWIRLANRSTQGALPRPIICYLDEFGSAGSVPRMAELIATLRSRHVALVLACQGFAQVEERYGKAGAETILSNASTHIVLPGVGQREAEFYSKRIGKTTITTQSSSRRGAWEVSSHRGETARWLIEPNEIRTLPARQALVLADVAAPLLVRVKPYYRIKGLVQQANLPFRRQPLAGPAQPSIKRLPPPSPKTGTGGLSPD
jgi:type IV secretion system protein VirD4